MGNSHRREQPPKYEESKGKMSLARIKQINDSKRKVGVNELYQEFRSIILDRIKKGRDKIYPETVQLIMQIKNLGPRTVDMIKRKMKPFEYKGNEIGSLEIFYYAKCKDLDDVIEMWNEEFEKYFYMQLTTLYNNVDKKALIVLEIMDDSFEIEM